MNIAAGPAVVVRYSCVPSQRETATAKTAIVILASTESHADGGRVVNGLDAAEEFAENETDGLELIFDGAGTRQIHEPEDENHDYHDLYRSVSENAAACDDCAGAFGVDDAIEATNPNCTTPLRVCAVEPQLLHPS